MQQVPQMRLVIAGDGPQRAELQKLAASLRLSNVEFVGQVGRAERDSLIAQSRFTVLPSHAYETMGKTILESYAEATSSGGIGSGIEAGTGSRGETGLLYRTGRRESTCGGDSVAWVEARTGREDGASRVGDGSASATRRRDTTRNCWLCMKAWWCGRGTGAKLLPQSTAVAPAAISKPRPKCDCDWSSGELASGVYRRAGSDLEIQRD